MSLLKPSSVQPIKYQEEQMNWSTVMNFVSHDIIEEVFNFGQQVYLINAC